MSRAKKQVSIETTIVTTTVTTVRQEMQKIGDKTANLYAETSDLKAAEMALKAYNGAISAGKSQLIYKKLTGTPGIIDFFEE
jgi:hypothetical protein